MATFTNQNKNVSTFVSKIRHGTDPTLLDLQNFLFTDDIFGDGRQLKDIAFSELVAQAWTNQDKSSAPTYINATKN